MEDSVIEGETAEYETAMAKALFLMLPGNWMLCLMCSNARMLYNNGTHLRQSTRHDQNCLQLDFMMKKTWKTAQKKEDQICQENCGYLSCVKERFAWKWFPLSCVAV